MACMNRCFYIRTKSQWVLCATYSSRTALVRASAFGWSSHIYIYIYVHTRVYILGGGSDFHISVASASLAGAT